MEPTALPLHRPCLLLFMAAFALGLTCCRPDTPAEPTNAADNTAAATKAPHVDFPAELHSKNPDVNAVVRDAMTACIRGDYDAFRRLWSAKDEPIPRERFVNHFMAVESMIVRALEADPDPQREAFAVCVEVNFDKEKLPVQHELYAEPRRLVIMLILREQNEWRFSAAPKAVRAYMAEKVGASGGTADDPLQREADRDPTQP
jgi:hypothetical protein